MIAYLVLLLAVSSRLLPPMLHVSAMNFTAVGGSLLFFGAKRPRRQSAVAVLALMATDVFLTMDVYHYPFKVTAYLATWAWYAGVCLLGSQLLRRVTAVRVLAGVVGSASSFFLLSNLMVWMSGMYAHTVAGLGACYWAAVPFFRNDLVSTGLVAGALFGLPALAARLQEHARPVETAL